MTERAAGQTLRQAVDESIAAAIERGTLDEKANAGPIALLRSMCDTLDGAGSDPIVWRYVTPASVTALCEKLGLLPSERQRQRPQGSESSTLSTLRGRYAKNGASVVGNSKWAQRMQRDYSMQEE